MKKISYIKIALVSFSAMFLLSSCLKDSRYIDYSKVGTLIELPLAETGDQAGIGGPLQSLSYSVAANGGFDTLTVAVNVASPTPLTSALNVTLSTTDTSVMHALVPDAFQLLPASDYRVLSGTTVTVPANQRLAYFKVLINAAAIGVANTGVYALPVTIESASGQPIAAPERGIVYAIGITQ